MKVNEIMSTDLKTIEHDKSLCDAAKLMESFDVGCLPVIQEDEIVGMLTDRDIVIRGLAAHLNPETTPVSDIMTPEVFCCYEDQSVEEAAQILEEEQVHRLVVLDNQNLPVGLISAAHDISTGTHDEHLTYEVIERICE